MTLFAEFAQLIRDNKSGEAIKLWTRDRNSLLREYRAAVSDEESDSWYGTYDVFDDVWRKLTAEDAATRSSFKQLILANVMLNEPDRHGTTPFSLLVSVGDTELIRAAIEQGADVNVGKTPPLSWVFGSRELKKNWRDIADLLLNNGAIVNFTNEQEPPLYGAINRNHRDAIRYLCELGANPNLVRETDSINTSGTAMHYCLSAAFAYETDIKTAMLLIEYGGDPTIRNKEGLGAIDAFFASDREPTENVLKIVELFSSTDSWKSASWYCTLRPPSSKNPKRTRRPQKPEMERVATEVPGIEVTFRIGDRVRVCRRGGYQGWNGARLDLIDAATGTQLEGEFNPVPGISGIVVGWDSRPMESQWKAVVEFDPGQWEEVDNFGKTRSLGRCRASVWPVEVLEITEPADETRTEANLRGPSEKGVTGASVTSTDAFSRVDWRMIAVAGVLVLFVLWLIF
ncbi:ankyrin repeat domain-containing protein [Pararhodobacter sp. SW119]|uniref:ankyrin repeat domain-containing protein n=1 Tax=Pararhodobacter sp. SW119 TaxID=2780075 RepID=UPI001ADF9321|nr:ankyrin repeat domain-containing protein [Pararhodobacter sp. SW119]